MSRKLSITLMGAMAILAVVALVIWFTPQSIVSQTPQSSGTKTGELPAYVYTGPIQRATRPLITGAKGSAVVIGEDTLRAAGGTGGAYRYDTSQAFPTHIGPYGLVMPKITYGYHLCGSSPDSVSGTLILQAAINPYPSTGGQWITIARLDSVYGNTATVTTVKYRTITVGNPDTLASYGYARFVWDNVVNPLGSTTAVYGGGDTTRIVICPLRVYSQTWNHASKPAAGTNFSVTAH